MEAPNVFEIVSERFVKPSTETLPSLRCYKLSYTDQIAVSLYVSLTFIYPNLNLKKAAASQSETTQILETALSKTLSYYYPFAGRLKHNLFVECNDMGVPFIEARFRCPISEVNPQLKDLLFHKNSGLGNHAGDAAPILVQITYFDDGSGIAVCISMSHKLGDASTLCAFMCDWATMVRQSNIHIPSPLLIGASLFPPLDELEVVDDPSSIAPLSSSINPVRKFLFCAEKIAQLRDMVAKSSTGTILIKNPTRVEVVTALLYRCAMVSSKALTSAGTLTNALSLRRVAEAELPKGCVGNFLNGFAITTNNKEEDITLPQLVIKLRNGKLNIQNEYRNKAKANGSLSHEDLQVLMGSLDMSNYNANNFYTCSSWCRIPFYEVDFGWGKPLLSFRSMGGAINHFTLIDTGKDEDSIEAIVMLKDAKDHMSAFQTNEELLAFASLIND